MAMDRNESLKAGYEAVRADEGRVAEARATLGVSTTREAVLAYVRLRER